MSSDKQLRRDETSQTGLMPRIELEPKLHRESPSPLLTELPDTENGATTGEMPAVIDEDSHSKTRDEDSPTGK